ncbi:VOC family protein [Paraflavitalea speifideaquila]|uniref:VOC family protein n=1 Tax=Paraflavitalea speifideaquila TaxID=3076558 RepID=UPI0028E20F15|nr:VOC family protein [Paraflavitalea speifideiaquila]
MIHISLTVANGGTLMATDLLESMEHQLIIGNNMHICIHTKSEAETEKIFNALSAGGKVGMPLNKTFWGAYFGMCTDKYAVQWMINYTQNQ